MRTIFVMGFRPHDSFWMGQEAMSKEDRDALFARLETAVNQSSALEEWRKNHPDARTDLGPDADAYDSFAKDEAYYASAALAVHDQLASDDPSKWDVPRDDREAAANWAYAVGQLYQIIALHPKGAPRPLPAQRVVPTAAAAPQAAAPAGTPTAPAGRPAPAGMRPAPGTPAAAAAPSGSTILGIPTTHAIVGGSLAVGVGVLLYSVLR